MKIEDLVDLLVVDLSREYSHWHFYIQASTSIVGLHREEIGEFLLEEANGEMKHVEEFKRMLHGVITRRNLNKKVPTKVAEFKNDLCCPKEILEEALRMEDEVVKNYVERIENACSLQENGGEDKVDGKFIELFLEDQITDSRKDADQIRMMIKNL
jgi:ferritin